MSRSIFSALTALVLAAALAAPAAVAQEQQRGLLDGLFGGSRSSERSPQSDPTELQLRINQLEAQIRQLTGTVEQLQFRNQQLEQQLSGGAPQVAQPMPGARPPAQVMAIPQSSLPPPSVPAAPGRRSDVFDPSQAPGAPGAPQPLGSPNSASIPAEPPPVITADTPIGAPGGRMAAGSPLDLSSLATNVPGVPAAPGVAAAPQTGAPLPPPPSRRLSATGSAVAPPSETPKDYYDLGYGYVLRKDYALAEDTFQKFLTKFPTDKLAADAQFWLGESMFQRQRYDDAAEAFLAASTKYEGYAKAPDSLLRLGQSLAALNQTRMACATLAEVGRKYPRASNSVKQGVDREQKRVRC